MPRFTAPRVARRLMEAVARGRAVRRTLPNGLGIYVSPDSQLKYLAWSFDTDLTRIAAEHVHAASVVWDVGANCGVFAFSSAAAREVVAIEADPFLVHLIQRSIALNGMSLTLVSAAAFSRTELAEFSIAMRGRASNHLSSVASRSQTGGERARILVPTITLDALLERTAAPTFVKIDVEGAEVEVLAGARRILHEVRPTIYLETVEETHEQCARLLADANYILNKGAEMNWLCTPA